MFHTKYLYSLEAKNKSFYQSISSPWHKAKPSGVLALTPITQVLHAAASAILKIFSKA